MQSQRCTHACAWLPLFPAKRHCLHSSFPRMQTWTCYLSYVTSSPHLPCCFNKSFIQRRIHADEHNDPSYEQRMTRWAKDEGASKLHHNRRSGSGAAAGAGAAVTGHRPRGATTAKSTRQAVPKRTTGAAAAPGSVRRTASALSAVANRSARFGT